MKENLAGRRYGRLTVLDNVIEFNNNQGRPERKWLCRCDCGTEKYIRERALRTGNTKSCGCYRNERVRESNILNLKGKTFGELTAIEQIEERGHSRSVQWRCQCSCGKEYIVTATRLASGLVTHCPDRKAHKSQRDYKIKDITGQKFGRLTALYPTEKRYCTTVVWHCHCDCGNEVDVPYNSLYAGKKSCGCLKKAKDPKMP